MTVRNSGPFARDRRSWQPPVPRTWPSTALIGVVIAASAVTLAACGGGSRANVGPAALSANSAAAGHAASGTTASAGGTAAGGGGDPTVGSTTTITGGTITTAPRLGIASRLPTAPAEPPSGGKATGSPATVPPAAQAVSCPLSGPPAQPIPADFEPVAVVRCVPVSFRPAEYRLEAAVSNLGPLMAALHAPPPTAASPAHMPPCLIPIAGVFQLALVGANGQVIKPLIPVNVCDGPSMPVVASLAALNWTTVS